MTKKSTSQSEEAPASVLPLMEEAAWVEVIQKMDEVYNDLLKYEVALEEKNAELEGSQRFIESVLSSMSDILLVCDRDGRIQDVNASLVRITGESRDGLLGTSADRLFVEDGSREKVAKVFTEAVVREHNDCELNLLSADGSPVPVSMNCTPHRAGHGRVSGVVLTGRPVGELRKAYTALHTAHEELKRAQQQLLHAEKLASLGRLVAGVAHELNNPISFVLGNVMALKRYTHRLHKYLDAVHEKSDAPDSALAALRQSLKIDRISEDMGPLIEGMIEGAERTRDIVDGLKRFSVVDRDVCQPTNVVDAVRRAVRWVIRSESGASATVKVSDELPEEAWASAESGRLQQVVMNVIQNAVDAMAGQPNGELRISLTRHQGSIRLHFLDTGAGFAESDLQHAFEPFFTTKPPGKGTGLGLSISYGILKRWGGDILVANRENGTGASVSLVLREAASNG